MERAGALNVLYIQCILPVFQTQIKLIPGISDFRGEFTLRVLVSPGLGLMRGRQVA
jgi:hypothetical protein